MSRIGIKPIELPNGVTVNEQDGLLEVTNGKNVLPVSLPKSLELVTSDQTLSIKRKNNDQETLALHGTVRMLLANAIQGLAEGWNKVLEFHGSGYRAAVTDRELELHLGYSHPIVYHIPDGIEITVVKNHITVSGYDKQQVGQVAAIIRDYRKPEPYKGKGIKYRGEHIIRKVGKALKSTA
ncbi:MAG: 50S ribosomal protein L6 [bacterium]|nr:50S ribosomal protein L6 [bacterium]